VRTVSPHPDTFAAPDDVVRKWRDSRAPAYYTYYLMVE
jgi:hypothetical protein